MTTVKLFTVRQRFSGTSIKDIEGAVAREMRRSCPAIKSGARIAVAVGSRGIADIERIVRAVAAYLREAGAQPFIVPAMGSHGGATAEGQARVLGSYGITGERVGAPVVSSMEVVQISAPALDNKVFMDRAAYGADGIVLVNRIKPHTDFHGTYESGLVKMAVIGLGKHAAAEEIHSFGPAGLRERIPLTFKAVAGTGKVMLGIAVVENAYEQAAVIEAVPGEQILEREPALLELARRNMPRLPVAEIDVLIVDWMGKEISGVGMDPNIIGRIRVPGVEEPLSPRIRMIVVTALTQHSYGNAVGIGLADVTTKKLFSAIDFNAMNINVRTSRFLERARVPFVADNDRDAFEVALSACGGTAPASRRIVRIRNTLHLAVVQVSEIVYHEIDKNVELVKQAEEIFDKEEKLIPF